MTRYCVNAELAVDAWAYVEAEDAADALERAQALPDGEFERGDTLHVAVIGVERDD